MIQRTYKDTEGYRGTYRDPGRQKAYRDTEGYREHIEMQGCGKHIDVQWYREHIEIRGNSEHIDTMIHTAYRERYWYNDTVTS